MAVLAYFEAAQALTEAREAREEFVDGRVDTALANAKFCWDGDKVRVSASNVGRSTIDTLNVSVIVDGVLYTHFVANVETNYGAGFWRPGYNATFNGTGFASEPARVVLYTPEGVPAYAPLYTCPVLNSIVVSPASVTGLDIGAQQEFTATGYDQFGNLYNPASYSWSSTCGSIQTLDYDTVRFTAGTLAGSCVITVTAEGVTKDAAIAIDPDPPASMVVSPDPRGVPAGGSATFTATVRDQYGNVNSTAALTWSTTAGTISSGGVLTAQTTAQLGRSVTATTTHGVSDSATVDVYAAAPATAVVSPDPEDVTVGTTETFSVVLTDAYGNVNATAPVTWTTNVGTITSSGAFTAQTTPATGAVTATSGAASDSATVHVKPGAPTSLVVAPDPAGVAAGGTRQFTATAYDSYGNANATSPITWTTNAGSVDAAGLLTAQTTAQLGRSVTATTGAVSDTATVDVYAAAPATAVVTPDAAGVTAGGTQAYAVTLTDSYGNVNSTATVSWTTNGGTISASGVLTAQTTAATGKTVTATSGAATDSATVDIIAAQPSTITVTPAGAGVRAGTTQQYTATARDQYDNVNSTATVTWSTNAGSIGGSGLLTAQTTAQNGRSVTATWNAVSGSTTVDVLPDAPSSVVVSPDPRGVPAGGSATFTATLRDQYNNLNTTASVSWTTNAGTISAGGVLTAQTTAQTGRSVTATSGSASGSATVDVYAAAVDRITVSPATANVYLNRTQQFTATVYDAYNNVNASVTVSWSATSGSISASGLYTAPSAGGSVTVTASASGKSGTATVTVEREAHVDAMATYKNGDPASSFRKGSDTVEVRTTVRDHDNNLILGGASVTIEFVDPDGVVQHTASGTTNGAGVASASYPLPSNAKQGTWTARVSTITGTHLNYVSSANVVSSVTFTVTAN